MLNYQAWDFYLRDYPDRQFVSSLLQIIHIGADIGFRGSEEQQDCTNLKSAAEHPDFVAEAISKLALENFALEMPPTPNSRFSPVGVVSRKRNPAKLRLINHLSWPRGSSVNDGIPDSEAHISYDMFERAIEDLLKSGPGSLMAKLDLCEAFHQIPVRASQWHLLGITWATRFYFMVVLTFGLKSAPYIFNLFAEALHWIIQRHIPACLRHYLDDFLMIFPPSESPTVSKAAVEWVMALGTQLGLQFQESKTVWPSATIEFLGLILDSDRMEARLPADKLKFLHSLLERWTTMVTCTYREVTELGGFLQFCSQVIPSSRTFLRRIFDFTSTFNGSHFIRRHIPSGVHSDIHWWLVFSQHWNGVRLLQPQRSTYHVYTDASGTKGMGGVFQNLWFGVRVARRHRTKDIQFKELQAILQAILRWGDSWRGSHILFFCDNQAVVEWMRSGTSRSRDAMPVLRILVMLAACLDFTFSITWIPSEENSLADAASRFQFQRLFELAPYLQRNPCQTKSQLTGMRRMLSTLHKSPSSSGMASHPALARPTPLANDPTLTSSACAHTCSKHQVTISLQRPEHCSSGLPSSVIGLCSPKPLNPTSPAFIPSMSTQASHLTLANLQPSNDLSAESNAFMANVEPPNCLLPLTSFDVWRHSLLEEA